MHWCLCLQGSAVAVGVQGDGGRRYNDGQWHRITATRRGAVGTIIINNQYSGNSSHIHTDHCLRVCVWCVGGCLSSIFVKLSPFCSSSHEE